MVKAKNSKTLNVLMNGRLVGFWYRSTTGATTFQYAEEWLATPGARPLSLSLPLRSTIYEGQQVYNFFDNLLPDRKAIRDRMQTRFQTSTNQPFDLLSAVGGDCVGAVQLCDQQSGPDIKTVFKQILTEADIAQLLRSYQMSPLGRCNVWCLPPYSPDLNKIERSWSWIKNRIRQQLEYCGSLREAMEHVLYLTS